MRIFNEPAKLFNALMWLLAILFAVFLLGLGNLIIRDLPLTQNEIDPQQFASAQQIKQQQHLTALQQQYQTKQDQIDLLQPQIDAVQNTYQNQLDAYKNWLSSREVTQENSQNGVVTQKAHELESIKSKINDLTAQKDALLLQQTQLSQQEEKTQQQLNQSQADANVYYQNALNKQQLKIFALRLCFILPILMSAVYLFVKKRKSKYWPFVWGFIFFAVYAFFVELVPYLPSYGGYVRYIVGLILVALAGYYGIPKMQAYLQRKQQEVQANEAERRQKINNDFAIKKVIAKVCPSCEHGIALGDETTNFCMYCGLMLFNTCPQCHTRHNAFYTYCPTCGLKQNLKE